jgi:hypothetical protein
MRLISNQRRITCSSRWLRSVRDIGRALEILCAALNQTNIVFPGTELQMRYSVATLELPKADRLSRYYVRSSEVILSLESKISSQLQA